MADETPDQFPDQSQARSSRSASVKFRDAASGADRASQLDEANKSLMDALRFSYTLLGIAMAVLGVLYFASGFQTINESERGVKLRFGSVVAGNLEPGPHWALPFPFGEIVRVPAGVEIIDVDEEYWPALSEQQKQMDPSDLPTRDKLSPERDGFLITADSAIAHARWSVWYSKRDAPRDFAQNILPLEEEEIVRAAISRGIIQAVATIDIEAFLLAGDSSRVVADAKRAAQDVLDQIQSGIQIDDLTMKEKTPPMYVRAAFEQVQSAESSSNQIRQEATSRRAEILNASAGAAAGAILDRIGRYENELEMPGHEAEAELVLAEINQLFDGGPTIIDGEERVLLVSGEVAQIMNDARQYRTNTVGMRRAEAIEFEVKNELFKSNPLVLVHTEWARGLEAFYARPEVYVTMVPEGTNLEIWLNKDPEYARALAKYRKEQENIKAALDRERARTQEQFKIDTGRMLMDG